ncbi:DUF2069 domain-containing protein [Thauera sp. 2A1]|uniref:DUF2069 domain-containing protein n=1 Tax=Thauera sp. 2A1 TaxID=2570191 RepID=UPI001292878B|nr:DUF2069 domain-containing protein [Thauera sp. 2A1]KAI5912815.1 DUF2069 domain-containing protein [Thauera sp. 2A1]
MSARAWSLLASASLLALIVLCVLWEAWLAPLRPGGSWMMLKVVPLLPAVFGILRGKRYTYQWMSMMSLLYVVEGVLRARDPGLVGPLAIAEAVLAVVLCVCVIMYARATAPSRQRQS